jgi:hypothetical protein
VAPVVTRLKTLTANLLVPRTVCSNVALRITISNNQAESAATILLQLSDLHTQ